MAQHDANHSSTERTILWTIIPATIGVSLLFTNLNHSMKPDHAVTSSDIGLNNNAYHQQAHGKPADHEGGEKGEHAPAADTSHTKADTLHVTPEVMQEKGNHQESPSAPAGEHDAPKH